MAYRDLNSALRERFGKKVYKISLSTPFACPNRDGTKGAVFLFAIRRRDLKEA